MKRGKYKIAMVSYLNSKPFEYGLLNHDYASCFDIITADPATCARLFEEKKVDISLIPAGALHDLKDEHILISDFCIGCDGEVRTVGLFSNVPLNQGRRLVADHHSRTSVLLSQVLLKEVFQVEIPVLVADINQMGIKEDDVVLMIGDKVFEKEHEYQYKTDLGGIWKHYTNLPFVFAVWAADKNLPQEAIEMLNVSLLHGINHIDKIIEEQSYENLDLYYYYKKNISYNLDTDKKSALKLFLQKSASYHTSLMLAERHV
ncbi:MAG: menaquinone biosynthesis protein [Saprospiraceae bacterium]